MIFCLGIFRFFSQANYHTGMVANLFIRTRSLGKRAFFNVNRLILFIEHFYLMLIGKVPTVRHFLMSRANPFTRSATPSPKRRTC